jgi:hypothetical protein
VLYDDGSYEFNVPRYRIKLNKSAPSHAELFSSPATSPLKKQMTAKKLKILERAASFSNSKSAMKLRMLNDNRNIAMPFQGVSLLQFDSLAIGRHSSTSSGQAHPQSYQKTFIHLPSQPSVSSHEDDEDSISSNQHTVISFQSGNSLLPATIQQYDEIKRVTEQSTVQIDRGWSLIYVGNNVSYACSHLIPQEILEDEPGIQAAVMFSLQIQGLDFPRYERSRLSKPMIFYTVNNIFSSATSPSEVQIVKNVDAKATDEIGGQISISKTKKEIITAVVNGQQIIQIEKRGYYTYGEGIGNNYD